MSKRRIEHVRPPAVAAAPLWRRRSTLLAACAVIFLFAMMALGGNGIVALPARVLLDVLVLILWLLGAWGIGRSLPLPLPVPRDEADPDRFKALAQVTSGALGLGTIGLLTLGLGLAGWLNRMCALAMVAAGLALAALHIARLMRSRQPARRGGISGWSWLWLAAMPFAAFAFVGALVPPGVLWGDEPNGYDVVEYHLQVPREWYEQQRIVPLEHNVFSYFPFGIEMHYLLAMHLRGGPWAGMFLAQLMHAACAGLTIAAVYGIARALSDPARATIAAVAASCVPWMALLAPVAYNEAALLLYTTLAIGWALVAMRLARPARAMALAGALAGLACGVKLTAVPTVLIAVPAAMVILALVQRNGLAGLRAGVIFALAGLVVFSPWLIRNAAWARGNPVFPEAQSLLGRAHFSEVQTERWRRAHSPREDQQTAAARLHATWRQILVDWRFAWLLLPLGAIAMALSRRDEARVLALLLVMLAVFWLALTHLQGRFFVQAIPMLALALAMVDQRPWRGIAAGVVAVTACVALVALAGKWSDLDRSLIRRTGGAGLSAMLGFDEIDRTSLSGYQTLPPDNVLALVGDAEAFLYRAPMKQLHYRTVFDVDTTSQGVIEAWLQGLDAPARAGAIVLVDPMSLERFHATYYRIPALPDALAGPRDRPFILPESAAPAPATPATATSPPARR